MQSQNDPDDVSCDGCGEKIHPMARHLQLPICTLYSGQIGLPLIICQKCSVEKMGLKPEVFYVG